MVNVDVAELNQCPCGRTLHQAFHTRYGNAHLFVSGQQQPCEGGQLADELQVEDKQGKITHSKAAVPNPLGCQNQDQAGAKVGGIDKDGVQDLGKQAVHHGCSLASCIQFFELPEYSVFAVGYLYSLDGTEHLADEANYNSGPASGTAPVVFDSIASQVGEQGDQDKGKHDHGCDEWIDHHHQDGTAGEQHQTQKVVHPQSEQRDIKGIAAESAHRLTWRVGQRTGTGPLQNIGEHILAQ